MKKLSFILLILFYFQSAFSQQGEYEKLIIKADQAYDTANYIAAFNYYDKAQEKAILTKDKGYSLTRKDTFPCSI